MKRFWYKKEDIWYLGKDAEIIKIKDRYYGIVYPRYKPHLGPYLTLSIAMKEGTFFLKERNHIPFER